MSLRRLAVPGAVLIGAGTALALSLAALQAQAPVAPAAAPASPPAPPPGKLNVLLILVDDLNFRIGAYGYDVKTPSLERLARRGRRFDHAYAQYPLCNPSRTSLMSGWRPERTKVWGNDVAPQEHLRGAVLLQDHFRASGYFTARVGKVYHGRFADEFSWDLSENADEAESDEESEARPVKRRRTHFEDLWEATDRPDAEEPDGRTARRVAELLRQHAAGPFFIAAGFLRPHGPWVAPRKYFAMYRAREMALPEQRADDLEDVPEIALQIGAEPPIPADKQRRALLAYSACVTFVDAQVGVLLEALEELKLWDRTVVVLASDNGIHRGEHGLWRKNTLFEESLHVPLIIAAPGIGRPGVPAAGLVELVDLYPTLVELAGVPPVGGLEGASLVPLLADPSAAVKAAAFSVTERIGRLATSVRTERYRYTEWPDGSAELYDHGSDPEEITNLAADPAHAPLVAELKRRLRGGYQAALVSSPR